ncbi:MAG: bifunctional folylpolyglutamate synthase/dihydrofolate synthase [Muribaculaceae bacterium]|nr:bifunctional folylpolyglutamate synthase/dihydrofolate synthase [Muribaculaceae bacterium]
MNYQETLDYLYNQRPAFERQGAYGYKPGLQTAIDLDNWLGNPHRHYRTIHVAGTNGKGSVSHMLAAILQRSGYRVGLFTSPHFVDFRERIRVNGEMVPQEFVVQFVDDFMRWGYAGNPSFFELTSAMALKYFADRQVDIAIIEVGLGGRLDSTNIITPILSVITNISLEHTEFLGDTVEEIAGEKAGIIKPGVPVVVGEAQGGVRRVFERVAAEREAPVTFAQDAPQVLGVSHDGAMLVLDTASVGCVRCELAGDYQALNVNTVLTAVNVLERQGLDGLSREVPQALEQVSRLTGLRGRWTRLGENPMVIADSAHNIAAITLAMKQLAECPCTALHMVMGFMADKDLEHILPLLPREATYYFTQAQTPRALKAVDLQTMAAPLGLNGQCYGNVAEALASARAAACDTDLIYVGGSMYVLAELFQL